MRYTVAVPRITTNIQDNLDKVLAMMRQASDAGTDILLFPEAILTGLNISDDYVKDKQIALPLVSTPVQAIINNAAHCKIWTAFGFLELADDIIYDSALLIDKNGNIALHYHRINPDWKAENADPSKYGDGVNLPTVNTPWGKTAFLICGDLFETTFPLAVKAKLDLLIAPFARCFPSDVTEPQKQWDIVEWPDYSRQIKMVGAFTLMANYIAPKELNGGGFGGGFIVSRDGEILKSKPLYEEGLLIYEQSETQDI
jgi:predicted amidohydrolase